jgi:hypothetical protein
MRGISGDRQKHDEKRGVFNDFFHPKKNNFLALEQCGFPEGVNLTYILQYYYIYIIIINTLRQIAQTSLKGMSKKKMKNAIETLLNSYVSDNAQFIKENGGNVAEYIMNTTESEENGWLWFLTEEEIEEFENNSERKAELIEQITAYVNENYNYNLLADELLEEWIVVEFPYNESESAIRMTRRSNFEEMDYCDVYNQYGIKSDCVVAGCYTLDNSESQAQSDCASAIREKFGVCVSLEECAGDWTVVETNDDDEFTEELIAEIEAFIKEWQNGNTSHTQVIGWTYHDSHNFRTVIMNADFNEVDCTELDKNEQIAILLQYPGIPHIEGTHASEETDDYIYHFDRWATNPWTCYVEKK